MKLLFSTLSLVLALGHQLVLAQDSTAQDTTRRSANRAYIRRGFGVWGRIGLTPNDNFAAIRQQLTAAGADASSIGDHQNQIGYSLVTDSRRGYSEVNFLYSMTPYVRQEKTVSLTKQAGLSYKNSRGRS